MLYCSRGKKVLTPTCYTCSLHSVLLLVKLNSFEKEMQSAVKITIFIKMFFLLVLSLSIQKSEAQIAFDVPCPNIHVVQDFDLQKYSGLWFEIESYPSIVDEFDTCVSLNYTVQTNSSLQVVSSWFNSSSRANESAQGTARVMNPNLGAKLLVSFTNSSIDPSIITDGNFWVIETDYLNYAIVYLCLPVNQNTSLQFLSYLSRQQFPFMTGLDFVRQRIESLGLNRRPLKRTCPFIS